MAAWYTSASHPTLQKDWGKEWKITWIFLHSSALPLFPYLKVFYQCHQVRGEFQCYTTLCWMIGCWWCCPRKIQSCGEHLHLVLFFEKAITRLWRPWGGNCCGQKDSEYEAGAAGLIHYLMVIEMLGVAWWFLFVCLLACLLVSSSSKCSGRSISIRLRDLNLSNAIPRFAFASMHPTVWMTEKVTELPSATDFAFILDMCKTCWSLGVNFSSAFWQAVEISGEGEVSCLRPWRQDYDGRSGEVLPSVSRKQLRVG